MNSAYDGFDAEVICEDTRAIDRLDWLELRRTGIGGSDAAAALGLSPWTSPVALWVDKRQGRPDAPPAPTGAEQPERFEWGHRNEPTIAQAFAERTGFEVLDRPVMLRSKRWQFMLANPDRLVVEPDGELAVLECKNVGEQNAHEWIGGPPIHYRLQGQHYLAVCGEQFKKVWFAALVGGNRLVTFEVLRDDDFIAEMIAAEEKFWTLVEMGRMPDVDGTEATRKALARYYERPKLGAKEVGESALELVQRRNAAKAAAAAATAALTEAENALRALIGDAEAITVNGDVIATWKTQTTKEHVVHESSYRVLKVMSRKEKP